MCAPARAVLWAVTAALALLAATPVPAPTPPLPKVPLHAEYVVAVNKLGQVTHIVSVKPSKNPNFNLITGGNALQAYIRTADGKSISGTYRLMYDYNPANKHTRRTVGLIRAGGVDPNAMGAVNVMFEDVKKRGHPETPEPVGSAAMTPGPQPSGLRLPNLQQILKTPAP